MVILPCISDLRSFRCLGVAVRWWWAIGGIWLQRGFRAQVKPGDWCWLAILASGAGRVRPQFSMLLQAIR
jgi:hypothetical protein